MKTADLQTLLSLVQVHGTNQMRDWMQNNFSIGGIPDDEVIEFLASRDVEWDDLDAHEQDQLRDAYLEGVFRQRLANAPQIGQDASYVDIAGDKWCPACGRTGAHFCDGGQPYHPGWASAPPSLEKPVVQPSEGSPEGPSTASGSKPSQWPDVLPGEGWRLLEPGEPLQEGDGFLDPDYHTEIWIDYACRPDIFRGNKGLGCPVRDYAHTWPWRRKTNVPAKLNA